MLNKPGGVLITVHTHVEDSIIFQLNLEPKSDRPKTQNPNLSLYYISSEKPARSDWRGVPITPAALNTALNNRQRKQRK